MSSRPELTYAIEAKICKLLKGRMSIDDAADWVGVSRATVSSWRARGKVEPDTRYGQFYRMTKNARRGIKPSVSEMENLWESFIEGVAEKLSDLEQSGNGASWEKARIIIEADKEARTLLEGQGLRPNQISHRVNWGLRQYWAERKMPHPKPSFLSHVRTVNTLWRDVVFDVNTNDSSWENYRLIATCSLREEQKNELRSWLESNQPTQAELRQRIREEVDATSGVYRPDFDLKVTNHWVFNAERRDDGFNGGVNYELYANLIHAYSDPGDTIIDPFAGGGILADTLKRYRHFREVTKADHSGPRTALMSDIAPSRSDIIQANASEGLPFPKACAALAILDPPYLVVSNGKYADLGLSLKGWLKALRSTLNHVAECLRPDGRVVVMTDDLIRKQQHEPMGLNVHQLLLSEGWEHQETIYNFNRNFISMSPQEMQRYKQQRFHPNAVKIIQVAKSC